MNQFPFTVSRENHLNHMVKVAPLVVAGYAIQCYFFSNTKNVNFAADSLLWLGLCLGFMIAAFITYDLKHRVILNHDGIEVSFLGTSKNMVYDEIVDVDLSHEGQNFANLTVTIASGEKFRFFFIDDAEKVKELILNHKQPMQKAA